MTGEVDKPVRFLCQILSGFNMPKIIKNPLISDRVIQNIKDGRFGGQGVERRVRYVCLKAIVSKFCIGQNYASAQHDVGVIKRTFAFQYASPRLWNQLPAPVRQPRQLRTNLSNSASPTCMSGTSLHRFHRLTTIIIHHFFTLSLQA